MAAAGKDEYSPIPPDPNPPQDDHYYILLPYSRRRHRHRHSLCTRSRGLICFTSLLIFLLALFFLWPSDPKISIVRLQLNHVHPHFSPSVSLDIDMALTVRVRNPDFFSLRYHSLLVSIGYRGRQLGVANSSHGFLRARASSYVNATLVLDGIKVIHDVVYLIQDLSKGLIPFDTLTEVRGSIGFLFFHIPIKAKVSCEVYADTDNQTVTRQNCYPE